LKFLAIVLACGAIAAIALDAAVGHAAAPGPPPPQQTAITHHHVTIRGQLIAYTAIVADNYVDGPDGQPAASLVTLAYVREDAPDPAHRPVMFVFNGGPGASSSPLNFGAFGPERFTQKDGQRALSENAFSLLDAVDLVFVDPVGTGVSRPFPGVDGQPFWSVSGDARSVRDVMVKWLHDHGRVASPHFLCGESYGTVRAGQIARIGGDLRLDGILLFSLVGGGGGADLPYVETFATMADAAAYHGRSALAGRPVRQVFDEASQFARTQLLPALTLGSDLPEADKRDLAHRMSRYLGMTADDIAAKDLRISKYAFMEGLLKDQGLRTGQLDTRAKGALADYKPRKPPYDDPSMSGAPNAKGPATGDLIDTHLAHDLGYVTSERYKSLNLEINAKWRFDAPGPGGERLGDPASNIGAAMKADPKLRLFWVGGLYDLTTPVAAARYALNHGGIPGARLTAVEFPTGHSVFETESALAEFTAAVRAFVTAP
jgi:carboxypeptidase C (cathepsin A)